MGDRWKLTSRHAHLADERAKRAVDRGAVQGGMICRLLPVVFVHGRALNMLLLFDHEAAHGVIRITTVPDVDEPVADVRTACQDERSPQKGHTRSGGGTR